MAKVSRKALQQIYDTLGEILNGAAAQDDAANKLDREDNDKARAQDSPRIGGMDSARTMRKLVPGYDRLRDGTGGRGETPDHGLRPSGRTIGRDGNEIS